MTLAAYLRTLTVTEGRRTGELFTVLPWQAALPCPCLRSGSPVGGPERGSRERQDGAPVGGGGGCA